MLTRNRQNGLKIEATEGTYETLAAADFAIDTPDGQTMQRRLTRYQRNNARAGLSRPKSIVGAAYGAMPAMMVELIGGGAATSSRAVWHDALQACGFAQGVLKCATLADAIVAVAVGSYISNNATYGTATKIGRVIAQSQDRTRVFYIPVLGTFADNDALFTHATAGGAGTTLSSSLDADPVDGGKYWTPLSETASGVPKTVTFENRDGELIHRLIGARGNAEFTFNFGEPAAARFNFEGPKVAQNTDGDPIEGGLVSNVTFPPG
ncbi:MAG: hypothetical protein K2Q20_02395, partial [Phycisphaerales bacterium]|nr:hypothetical protein [Phycisphaerales bacterium]